MSDTTPVQPAQIVWHDLTVDDAEVVRDFYAQVVGWRPQPVSVGDYVDFCMNDPDAGGTVAGICHARGENAKLPPQWLMYVAVEDVEAAAEKCLALGGQIVDGPRRAAGKMFCVIRDPAGAVAALIQA